MGVPIKRALLVGVYTRARDLWKLLYDLEHIPYIFLNQGPLETLEGFAKTALGPEEGPS